MQEIQYKIKKEDLINFHNNFALSFQSNKKTNKDPFIEYQIEMGTIKRINPSLINKNHEKYDKIYITTTKEQSKKIRERIEKTLQIKLIKI